MAIVADTAKDALEGVEDVVEAVDDAIEEMPTDND